MQPSRAFDHHTSVWLVMRQDDNGNVFVVAELASEAAARTIARELEARAHKQMYWVEPRTAKPRDANRRVEPTKR
jgi:hypothetical protein